MAFDALLKLDGIDGESAEAAHKGEIILISFSWGEAQVGGRASGTSAGAGVGKVSMQDFHFSMNANKASPQLFGACASGKHIPSAVLTVRKAGAQPAAEYFRITLTDVLVSSFQTGGNLLEDGLYSPLRGTFDIPIDQFTLNFGKISYSYTAQLPTGKTSPPTSITAGSGAA